MNAMKNQKSLRLLALLLCFVMLLTACGGQGSNGQEQTENGLAENEASYQVTVVDALGNPYTTGMVVSFLQNGQQVAMQSLDANGVATKVMEKGEYTVELVFTGDESAYYYEKSDLTLTADKTEVTMILANAISGEPTRTLVVDGKDCDAYEVNAGCTYVTLEAGERNYFLFTPTEAGTYEFSVSDSGAQIGYYGAPHFVQSISAAEVEDNAFTISVSASMIGTGDAGTSVFVIGVDAGEVESCMLTVERIGDPEWNVADEPWTVYEKTVELSKYTLPEGAKLEEFDLTASTDTYNLVLNEEDGFYHLDSADGPLVLVRLGEDNKYLDCYETITSKTGVNKYFYDENGEFVRKESYTNCLLEYIEYMDEDNGVYPLTEDLKYIIQQSGDHSGWFDPDGMSYLFVDDNRNPIPGINTEIVWLFMCCYIAG